MKGVIDKPVYDLELEKQKKILNEMIEKGYTKEEILKQSEQVDKLVNMYIKKYIIKN